MSDDSHSVEPTVPNTEPKFQDLGLIAPVLKALDDVGYETPSPIQAEMIPHMLAGKDVVGQAQTGTGKTAAFALPLLSRIDLKSRSTQVLVLAPTRELAIQVAEAFQSYAAHIKNFHVLPIYGGSDYSGQIRGLKRGAQVVVGTPGRVMDHMRKGTLKLNDLSCLVLDEADEMLRMGFIDDVEWVLEQTPDTRQIALFSATMPSIIRKIAKKHLSDPVEITIKSKTATAPTIRQRYMMAQGGQKLEAMTRILESETFEGVIVFVRTKTATVELAEKLAARGHATGAINGDIAQKQREKTIERLKKGQIDILVATDVAARGLDVPRISHVINYDIPYDTEGYVHRIGRTGRAGREGDAILFVAPRERRLLGAIEKATKTKIELMQMPSAEQVNEQRVGKFKDKITETLESRRLGFFQKLLEDYQIEHDKPMVDIAAALATLLQGDSQLLVKDKAPRERSTEDRDSRREPRKERNSGERKQGDRSPGKRDFSERKSRKSNGKRDESTGLEDGMETFRIEVGNDHGVRPANIVGAIANEAGIDSRNIGRIKINDSHSFVDLPEGMPKSVFKELRQVWVSGQKLNIARTGNGASKDGSEGETSKSNKPADKSYDKLSDKSKKDRSGKNQKTKSQNKANKSDVKKKPKKSDDS